MADRATSRGPTAGAEAEDRVLQVQGLHKTFPAPRGRRARLRSPIRAVVDVSFQTLPHGVLGIVGETGSGKTTLVRCIAGLTTPSQGTIRWGELDLSTLSREQWRLLRRDLQIVLQNPYTTLDPRMRILDIVAEPLQNFQLGTPGERLRLVRDTLQVVGLGPGEVDKRPVQLSGGQRQRVAIARALVLAPKLLILDEPVSALDVSIQAQVINLLLRLQQERGLSYIVVLHDLAVARQLCDSLIVMHEGRIVEAGEAGTLLAHPEQPYTQALLRASPDIGRTSGAGPEQQAEAAGGGA